jgi:hypothetical protein
MYADVWHDLERIDREARAAADIEWYYSTAEQRDRAITEAVRMLQEEPRLLEQVDQGYIDLLTVYNMHVVKMAVDSIRGKAEEEQEDPEGIDLPFN